MKEKFYITTAIAYTSQNSSNYGETVTHKIRRLTTDANGEIFIENLRIGKYTVTEVEDSVSAGYKRPDPFEIELAADETLTVNVHNDKVTTDHPDSPKTGDNSHMALWLGLMLASLGVLIGTILYSRKKKHLAD